MALVASPIDFGAVRRALVMTIAQATGLPTGSIVREEAQGPVQPRPNPPFAAFKFTRPAQVVGYRDSVEPANDPTLSPTAYYYYGHRMVHVEVNFFGSEQDLAYSLAAAMQAALYQAPTRALLRQGGASVSSVLGVTDVSSLLGTGFEGRALVEFELFVKSVSLVDLGEIDQVTLIGQLAGAPDGATIGTEDPVNETSEG